MHSPLVSFPQQHLAKYGSKGSKVQSRVLYRAFYVAILTYVDSLVEVHSWSEVEGATIGVNTADDPSVRRQPSSALA